jgi:hypothetical protein
MARPSISEAGNVIVKKNPWEKGLFYIARRSFPVGAVPAHLTGYTNAFTAAAKECSSTVRGMPAGKEKIRAMRGCMSNKLGR